MSSIGIPGLIAFFVIIALIIFFINSLMLFVRRILVSRQSNAEHVERLERIEEKLDELMKQRR